MKTPEPGRRWVYTVMILAAAVWTVLFHPYYTGRTGLFPDGYSYFHWTKFYFDSVSSGSYPLWNPFVNWGFPVGFKMRFLGEFNPLLLIAFIPYKLGVPYLAAYFLYAVSYFLIGAFGFYLICRRLLPGRWWACFGFVLLLFSNLGIAIFFNYCEIVLLVPGIWFFYFWLRFHEQPGRGPFLGIIFSSMLILVSYMPFYFITVFAVFVLTGLLMYARQLPRIAGMYGQFIRRHPVLVAVAAGLLLVSAVPGYVTYRETSSAEFSYEHRQADSQDSAVTTGLGMVNAGSILGPLTVRGLFAGLQYADNYLSYFFLSVIVYPILLMGLWAPLSRRAVMCFVVAAVMFLITLTEATPVLEFCYDHVFYFKLIRNIFYLFYLAVPFAVLYVLLVWQAWWKRAEERPGRAGLCATVCCLGFLVCLLFVGDVLLSQYVSVAALWVIVMVRLRGRWGRVFWPALIAVTVIQPVDVYRQYLRNVDGKRPMEYAQQAQRPVFAYQRPRAGQDMDYPPDMMPGSSGYVEQKFAGTSLAADLQSHTSPDRLSEYTRHKLIVYDSTDVMDPARIPWPQVEARLAAVAAPAIVFNRAAEGGAPPTAAPEAAAGESDRLAVRSFGLNQVTLQTDYPRRKFLVYNDSYHSGWQVTVNGRPHPLYRANIAFKGIWLDAGKNKVTFRFGPRWLELFYFLLSVIFAAVFMTVIRWERRDRRQAHG